MGWLSVRMSPVQGHEWDEAKRALISRLLREDETLSSGPSVREYLVIDQFLLDFSLNFDNFSPLWNCEDNSYMKIVCLE